MAVLKEAACMINMTISLGVGPMASLFTEAPQVKSISRLPSGKSRTDSLDPPNTAIVLANTSLTVLD